MYYVYMNTYSYICEGVKNEKNIDEQVKCFL